jgi:hypothetical protein
VGRDAGDTPDEQLPKSWIAAQELRLLYRCPDRARAEQHLYGWLVHCADAGVPELQDGDCEDGRAGACKRAAQRLWVPENVHRACDLLLRVRQGPGMVHRWRFG